MKAAKARSIAMDSLLLELNHICSKNLLTEKVVIVDSHTIGEQINEAFIKAGFHAINLKFKTVADIAQSLAELNVDKPFTLLDQTVGVHLTYNLLCQLKEQGAFRYFSGMEITPSFSQAIYSMLQTLRLTGYTRGTLKKEAFITSDKAEDMTKLLTGYENILAANQLIDFASLIQLASEYARTEKNTVFILQSDLKLSPVEEQFLQKILPETAYKLPLAPVFGVNIPERTSLRSIRWGHPQPLSYLYQQEDTAGEPNIFIFPAKTEELEVKRILSQIKTAKIPVDENVVFYTSANSYITLFYHMSQKMNLPITFAEGLPVSFSRPGRLVSGLLDWIESNYTVQVFLNLMNEGLFELGEDAPTKIRIAKILRDLQIGWSQERYLVHLEMEIERLNTKRSQGENSFFEARIKELSWLKQWFSTIFKKLPPLELAMNYKHCLAGIAFLLKNYSRTTSLLDELTKTALLEEIEKILPYAGETLSSYAVIEKISDLLLTIRVNQSRPKPGHLHVASYMSGIYNSRPHVFIVGLDNKKFPGTTNEDPLLLDTERLKLSSSLPLFRDKGQENLYILLQVLAESTGQVTVSYCDFDINHNRVMNPAFVVLQCYRLMTGNKNAEFNALKTLSSPIIANEILEEKDFWNEKFTSGKIEQLSGEVLQQFQHLNNGLAAEIARNTEHFTEFDGQVQIDAKLFDPRLNPEKTMTAGKFETLAKCPYSYFLKEVLRIKPVEDVEFNAHKWLDPATRGSLLHSIFETFYKQLTEEKVKPSYKEHLDRLVNLARELTEQHRELLPPPNERVYQSELSEILDCCTIFLKDEERHSKHYTPLYFEYQFGIGSQAPAELTLPSGEIKVSGIIDRLDQSNSGDYHIIDYKTGSTFGYEKNGAFHGGRQLQHMIYALAIEQHLQLGDGAVAESAYYFPTVKGMAEKYTRRQDQTLRTNGIAILEKLITIMERGEFTMTDDENDCKFCDFKLVCRRHFYNQDILKIKQSNQLLKGVRVYD